LELRSFYLVFLDNPGGLEWFVSADDFCRYECWSYHPRQDNPQQHFQLSSSKKWAFVSSFSEETQWEKSSFLCTRHTQNELSLNLNPSDTRTSVVFCLHEIWRKINLKIVLLWAQWFGFTWRGSWTSHYLKNHIFPNKCSYSSKVIFSSHLHSRHWIPITLEHGTDLITDTNSKSSNIHLR